MGRGCLQRPSFGWAPVGSRHWSRELLLRFNAAITCRCAAANLVVRGAYSYERIHSTDQQPMAGRSYCRLRGLNHGLDRPASLDDVGDDQNDRVIVLVSRAAIWVSHVGVASDTPAAAREWQARATE
jgi:hypothetical protein